MCILNQNIKCIRSYHPVIVLRSTLDKIHLLVIVYLLHVHVWVLFLFSLSHMRAYVPQTNMHAFAHSHKLTIDILQCHWFLALGSFDAFCIRYSNNSNLKNHIQRSKKHSKLTDFKEDNGIHLKPPLIHSIVSASRDILVYLIERP